jgi:hypothetical protein
MKVRVSQFLPLVSQLGNYLKTAIDHYSDLRAAGSDAGPDVIAMFLENKMASWDPKLNRKSLLDSETRSAAARFLAGVAVNFTRT